MLAHKMLPMVDKNAAHTEFAARLNEVLRKNHKSISDLMGIAGVTYEMARRYTKGTAKPREDKISLIAEHLGCSEAYLSYGSGNQTALNDANREANAVESRLVPVEWNEEDQDSGEFYTVPLLDIELAAGEGSAVLKEVEQYKLPFRKYTLRSRGVDPQSTRVVRVIGNSMTPVLSNGDAVGIDTSKTKIIDGDTYAIRDGDLLRVKILIERPDGGIIIRSFNHDEYPDETLSKTERYDRITIIGRVWWSSKLW